MGNPFFKKRGEDVEEPDGDSAGAESPGQADAEAPDDPARAEPAGETDPLTELTRQRDQYLEMWQRARADYQNLRRRSLADVELATRRAKEALLHELLLVLDNLDMALASEVRTEEGRNLLLGVRMTRDQMMQVLEREGVQVVPEGGTFDPALHQAVAAVETDEHEPGAVVTTLRKGYKLGDHALRHAHVQVAAAPGEAAREQEATEREAGGRGSDEHGADEQRAHGDGDRAHSEPFE